MADRQWRTSNCNFIVCLNVVSHKTVNLFLTLLPLHWRAFSFEKWIVFPALWRVFFSRFRSWISSTIRNNTSDCMQWAGIICSMIEIGNLMSTRKMCDCWNCLTRCVQALSLYRFHFSHPLGLSACAFVLCMSMRNAKGRSVCGKWNELQKGSKGALRSIMAALHFTRKMKTALRSHIFFGWMENERTNIELTLRGRSILQKPLVKSLVI